MAKLLMPFSNPTTYAGHSGIDYGVPTGTPVRSSQPGVIVESRWFNKRSGYMRALRHDNGIIEKGYHLRDLSGPGIGTYVPPGTPWAYTGNTGTMTTGPHLHHEIWLNDWLRSGDGYWLYVDRGVWVGQGSTSGGGSTAFPVPDSSNTDPDEEEEMALHGASYTRSSDNTRVYLIFNEVSGFWQEHSGVPGEYNNSIAQKWGTGSWASITEAHARVIKNGLDKVRVSSTNVSGAISVEGLSVQADLSVDADEIAKAVNDEDDRREQAERDILNRGGV